MVLTKRKIFYWSSVLRYCSQNHIVSFKGIMARTWTVYFHILIMK